MIMNNKTKYLKKKYHGVKKWFTFVEFFIRVEKEIYK